MATYEITKAAPQQLQMQVKYSETDKPDFWVNFRVTDFSEAALHGFAKQGIVKAREFWDGIEGLPESVTLDSSEGTAKNIVYSEPPTFDPITHKASFDWVESDEAVTQTWTISDKSDEEKAQAIRGKRDSLILETDRFALSDMTLTTAMATYRQALRDVPQQTDFPASVTWPNKPE